MDPLKVFLGQLHPTLIQWQLAEWLEKHVAAKPVEIIMRPPKHAGLLQCAIVTWPDEISAIECIHQIHGCVDPHVTPSQLQAHWEHHGSLYFDFRLVVFVV